MIRPFTIDEIREISVPIAKEYGVTKLALFGSYAKNLATAESDVDFLVDATDVFGLAFYGFIGDLEEAFGVHVDAVEYEALEQSGIKHVINDEVTIYEREFDKIN